MIFVAAERCDLTEKETPTGIKCALQSATFAGEIASVTGERQCRQRNRQNSHKANTHTPNDNEIGPVEQLKVLSLPNGVDTASPG